MPYVRVHIDKEDILDDLTDDDLREELASRASSKVRGSGYAADYRIPAKAAQTTVDEAAQIFRKMGRNDLAFKLDEIKVDFLGH